MEREQGQGWQVLDSAKQQGLELQADPQPSS